MPYFFGQFDDLKCEGQKSALRTFSRCRPADGASMLFDCFRYIVLYIIKKIINAFLNKKKYNKTNNSMAFYRRRFAEAYYEKRTNEFYGTRRHAYRG